MLKKLFEIVSNRKIRNAFFLTVLAIILCIVCYEEFFSGPAKDEGDMRVVKCAECGHLCVKKIKDINNPNDSINHCEKCGKQLGYAYKCENCDREFSIIPAPLPAPQDIKKMKTMAKFEYALEGMKCPNCGSTQTHPILVDSPEASACK